MKSSSMSKADGSTSSATYQLMAGPGVELRSYPGQEGETSGVLETEQTVTTSGETQQKPSTGAAGTPTVDTRAELEVRTFNVSSVNPTGNRCSDGPQHRSGHYTGRTMLRTAFLVLFFALPALAEQTRPAPSADEQAVRDVVRQYVNARELKDPKAIEALFTEDAD